MKSILEIVNFYNDDQPYIITEDQQVFTFANLKKQITWTKDFFKNNQIQKTDTIAIVSENGPIMATSFLATACYCRAAPLNPTYTSSEFDYYSVTGSGGSVNFWSAYILHGTTRSPATNSPRISLRYLIERGKSTEELPIDKFLKTITGPLTQGKSNKDSSYSDGKIQVGKQKGTGLLAGQVNTDL